MEINLEQLKKKFVTIKDIRNKVTIIFQILENHLTKLKHTFYEFVVNNKQHLFVFGLDSFQFQSKLIDIECDDMKRLFLAINNRMYCEYYKLYKIISEYVNQNITDKKTLEIVKVTNTFPVYKDLEPYKQYNFETIQEIHENIILLLYGINEFIVNKESELQIHQKKQKTGLNINNFVTTFNYNIVMIKEKGLLFISYIEFFHTLHTKYLQRFAMKMNLMYTQVTHDIRFDDTPKTTEIKKKELINNFENDQVDISLIKQIRNSFDDSETNSNEYDSPSSSSTNSHKENELSINNVYSKNIQDEPNQINSQSVLKNIFTKNVKKIVGGIFKKKKEDKNSSSDSGNSTPNKNIEQIELLKYKKLSLSNDLTPHSGIVSIDVVNKIEGNVEFEIPPLINPLTLEDEEELKMTLSKENMFLEITKQCNEITLDFETVKNNSMALENDQNIHTYYVIQCDRIENVGEEIVEEKVEENIEIKIEEKVEEKNLDDNLSVITMESLSNKNDHDENNENKPDEETKKKRQYKPRKKKNT